MSVSLIQSFDGSTYHYPKSVLDLTAQQVNVIGFGIGLPTGNPDPHGFQCPIYDVPLIASSKMYVLIDGCHYGGVALSADLSTPYYSYQELQQAGIGGAEYTLLHGDTVDIFRAGLVCYIDGKSRAMGDFQHRSATSVDDDGTARYLATLRMEETEFSPVKVTYLARFLLQGVLTVSNPCGP